MEGKQGVKMRTIKKPIWQRKQTILCLFSYVFWTSQHPVVQNFNFGNRTKKKTIDVAET
jgi:hypothetical protein